MAYPKVERPGLFLCPGYVFTLIFAAALALRLVLALTYPAMWGVDGGASLLTLNAVLGDEPTGAGFPKPPLAPGWQLVPFVLTLGPDVGYKVWSALASILPLFPIFLLARKYAGDWPAVFATGFAAIDLTSGEMFVTGAHPLVAFALLGMAWYSMGELSERFSLRWMVVLALGVGLIPWVNQTAAGLALIVLPVFWGALWWHSHSARRFFLWNTTPPLLVGGVIALAALPWYLDVLPGSSILRYQGPWIFPSGWADSVWIQSLFIALPLGIFVLWKATDARVKALGAVLVTLGVLVPWQSYDETVINIFYRSGYLMQVAFYPLIAWVVDKHWIPLIQEYSYPKVQYGQWFIWGSSAGAFILVFSGFLFVVYRQAEYSTMVTQETAEALELLRENDPGAGVATNSFTLSLWVAALNKVHSPFAFTEGPPPAYLDDDEWLRCVLNWVSGCAPRESADLLGVKYLLIDERWPEYNKRASPNYLAPPDQWERTAEAPWLELVYSEGTTRLWRIDAGTEQLEAAPHTTQEGLSATTTPPRT